MSRIGIIYCAYNTGQYVWGSLTPWMQARTMKLNNHDFVIAAVSLPFAGFPSEQEDNTIPQLREWLALGQIDTLITEPKNVPETVARSMALRYLKDQGCDLFWQADSDEFPEIDDIQNIIRFVGANPFAAAFRLSLKNYVFDDKTYLVEPFTPMRIHRLSWRSFRAEGFWADNNVFYRGGTEGYDPRDTELPIMTVPLSIAWLRHLTWQSDLRSKKKIEYQLRGRNWPSCQFSWDDTKGLIFNPALPAPQVARDE